MSPSQVLKIHRDSHAIKKPPLSPPSQSSSSCNSLASGGGVTAARAQQTRHPVIIYTHSPKIIHAHPRDFMELVQKLTGLPRSPHRDDEDEERNNKGHPKPQPTPPPPPAVDEDLECAKAADAAGGVTEEENGVSSGMMMMMMGDTQMNSFLVPPPPPPLIFDPYSATAANYLNAIPFLPNSAEFLCSATPFYNGCTADSLMPSCGSGGGGDCSFGIERTSTSPISTLDGDFELREP